MGNKKKIGTARSCYRKKTNVGVSKSSTEQQTPVSYASQQKPKKISSSKLKLGKNCAHYDSNNDTLQYEIINMDELERVLNDLAVCKFCHTTLQISKKSLSGLASKFRIFCGNCEFSDKSFVNCKEICFADNSPTGLGLTDNKCYDLNLRLVYGLRTIGKGYTCLLYTSRCV